MRHRRGQDGFDNYYVDRLQTHMWAVVWLITGLSLMDAIFTLYYLSIGFVETNPLLRLSLLFGSRVFLIFKYILTLVGVLFICLHQYFRFIYLVIGVILAAYVFLNVCHVAMLW